MVIISCYSVNGRNVGIKALLEDEWVFMNEVGIEITLDQAVIIRNKIREHKSVYLLSRIFTISGNYILW